MSFAAGIGPGIGVGFAVGLGAGMVVGRKKAADDFRRYMETHNVTIRDGQGEMMVTDDFLHQALGTGAGKNDKVHVVIGIALGILGILGLVFFLLR